MRNRRSIARGILFALFLEVSPGLPDSAFADEFPHLPIPPSDRILTVEEVKNFWINSVQCLPVPPEPSGLHPRAKEQWRDGLRRRQSFVRAVRSGVHDTRAIQVQLRHNARTWRLRGNEDEADTVTKQLRKLREHLARMNALKAQRRSALAQIAATEKLAAIEAELAALRSSCSSGCCSH
jgi:hypothetical protein